MVDFPPSTPQSMQRVVPAYLYQQYTDDDDLQGFFQALNDLQQGFIDWFNATNLPIYTGLSGSLLDWVALGLYGTPRPILSFEQGFIRGPLATWAFADPPELADEFLDGSSTLYTVTDDIFKRILTWNFYKGDGWDFDIRWLKRRFARFMAGANGVAPNIDQTYGISVTQPGRGEFVVTVYTPDPTTAEILRAALEQEVCHFPFQFTITEIIVVPVLGGGAWWNYTLPIDFSTRSFLGQFQGPSTPL